MIKAYKAPNGFRYVLDRPNDPEPYRAVDTVAYYSKRYDKYVTVTKGDRSDGATGAFDIESFAWWVHDQLCKTGRWDDGTLVTNWQCSTVLADILWEEGRYLRSVRWFAATFALGGGEARKNGMFTLKPQLTR